MEILNLPSQEVLTFTKVIRNWIIDDHLIGDRRKFVFRGDTLAEISDLYEEIKP